MSDVARDEIDEIRDSIASSLVDIEKNKNEKILLSLERQEVRVQECIDELLVILSDHIPQEILIQAVTQFESIQLRMITNRLKENKHFTKNQIAMVFLAILDNLLALIYEKITPEYFSILRHNIQGMGNGKSFSYNTMKKIQIELFQDGYISRIKKLSYTLQLKDRFCKVLSNMMSIYPQYIDKLHELEIRGYNLIHTKSILKIDVTRSAAVVVGSLIKTYFSKKDDQEILQKYVEDITDEDYSQFRRKIYRFKYNLKKEGYEI
ncbi:MAG: hypothetical protein ACFFDS_02640 [Candidatus Thorarchaeota archaeon]